jgi:hypothetical protein
MDRQSWMLLRAYFPAAVLLGLAFFVTVWFSGAQSRWLIGTVGLLYWVPFAIAIAALAMFVMVSVRLWRWERGDGPSCVVCGGPLGGERSGRADRGGAFRRCYACGKAVNHRYYEQ